MAGPVAWEGALIPHALRAAQEGYSANQWLTALRDLGRGVRRGFGLKVFAEAKALAAEYGQEPARSMESVPRFGEMRQWPTRGSTGVLQTVKLFYREKVTGNLIEKFYSVRTAEGITRQEAVNRAIDAYESSAPVNQGGSKPIEATFEGAAHTGAAILTPTAAG